MDIHIYALKDPTTLQVRYIGRSQNPINRLTAHLGESINKDKTNWITQLKQDGLKPLLEILEVCDKSESEKRERWHIKEAVKNGSNLLNQYDNPNFVFPKRPRPIVRMISVRLDYEIFLKAKRVSKSQGRTAIGQIEWSIIQECKKNLTR